MRTIHAVAASVLLAGCSAPPPAQSKNEPPDFRSPAAHGPSEPFTFKHASVDVQAIPAFWITPDVDSDQTTAKDADFDTGAGVMARAGLGSGQQNIGLMYMGTWQTEQTTDTDSSTQAVYLDFLYRAPVRDLGEAVWFTVAAGVGAAAPEFDSSQFDDQVTGAVEMRGELEFRIIDPLSVSAGLGGFLFGNPGDTVAYGTYLMVGAKLLF